MNEEIKDLMGQIKNRMKELGATEFILYAEDYWEDLDAETARKACFENAIGIYMFFHQTMGYDESRTTIIPRKVKIKDDEVVFDIGELYEAGNYEDENEETYEDQTIEEILRTCPEDTVKNGLEVILSEHLNNDEMIKYNNL